MDHKCPICGHQLVKRTKNNDFFSSVSLFSSPAVPIDISNTWECKNPECLEFKIEKSFHHKARDKREVWGRR